MANTEQDDGRTDRPPLIEEEPAPPPVDDEWGIDPGDVHEPVGTD